ncbi:hypothetical protein AeNC1_010299 [Aphanomyces euteiches]|nr:hypothetical protein AeNC1_010299 [Aphanomyces euteiches]
MRNNLSVAYSLIGDYSLSSQLLMERFESYRRTLGPKHTSTLAIQANLGNAYRLLGRFAEAEAILLDCLSHEDHDKFTKPSSKRYLGLTYMSIGDYDRATKYYTEALDMLEGVVGRIHDIYARSLMPMYLLQLKTASFESLEAIEAFESILRDVKWTQDLWKYTICHGCRREVQGVLCVSDCPVYSFRYCASCTTEKKPEFFCNHGLDRIETLTPPARHLKEKRLEILSNLSKWTEYDEEFTSYQDYCQEHQVPASEQVHKRMSSRMYQMTALLRRLAAWIM